MKKQFKLNYLGTVYSGTKQDFLTAIGPSLASWYDSEDDEFQSAAHLVEEGLNQLEPITPAEAKAFPRIAAHHLTVILNELSQAAQLVNLPEGSFRYYGATVDGHCLVHFEAWGQYCDVCRFASTEACIASIAAAVGETMHDLRTPDRFWRTLRKQAGYLRTIKAKTKLG